MEKQILSLTLPEKDILKALFAYKNLFWKKQKSSAQSEKNLQVKWMFPKNTKTFITIKDTDSMLTVKDAYSAYRLK